ncbi:MAG: cytochrome c [Bacteroidia bacterium]|nr:cytochrome c [Bacteroidia bacterium]
MKKFSSFFPFLFTATFFCSCGSETKTPEKKDDSFVTFSTDIAPLIYKNCSPCHRPGQAGPFDLLSYNDVKKNANRIKFATTTHFMPPWPADPSYSNFIGERVLTQNEIDLIKNWIENKMPVGDSTKIPSPPEFYNGSFFGKPDLVVRMQEIVKLKSGRDNFFMIKFPYEIAQDTFVCAIEFVPHKRKLIHHVNGHTISFDDNKKKNVYEGKNILPDMQENFVPSFKEMGLANDDGTFPLMTPNTVYYLPGFTPPQYPGDVGGYVLKKKGAFLLKNIHYGPSPEDVNDSSYINIFFTDKKPKRPIKEIQLGTFGVSVIEPALEIPANQIKTFHTQWKVPVDISLLSVNPHMHLLGKNFLAYAISPNGDTIKLIRINKWDFRWQYYYTFPSMKKIPAGSIMHAYATYDNTKENLLNPFSPPQLIKERKGTESMRTTEEMFQFIFTYVPYKAGDENVSLERK